MIIYGAGMAGLIAANMLRRFRPVIHEAQPTLPNNHAALLRFRTDAVSRVTGIPFRKVRVYKGIKYQDQVHSSVSLVHANLYSRKVTGAILGRSILNLEPVDRYIAPSNFIAQVSCACDISYGCPMRALAPMDTPVISTIPMPALMKLAEWPNPPEFKYRPIWAVCAEIVDPVVDVYQTIYYPEPELPYYRASITGKRLTIEYIEQPVREGYDMARVMDDFGIHTPSIINFSTKYQPFGKLLPIEEEERRRFVLAMTDLHGIYSLGRFGTWRQILMDDVVQDVQRLEQWITERDAYTRRLQQ